MQEMQLKEQLYFIGDVHAQHHKLVNLLAHINFNSDDPTSSAGNGQLVFLGDLIDLGDESYGGEHLAVLNQVKSLVQQNHAFCLLGNHEFNAIGWATAKDENNWARPHSEKNRKQHCDFLAAVEEGSKTHDSWIKWFKTLPLFIDFKSVKAIHACWDEQLIARLKPYLNADNSLKEEHWLNAFNERHELFTLCETLLKGPEKELPAGQFFTDRGGETRTSQRIEWWFDFALQTSAVPVVIGHYARSELPESLSEKVVCVDYGAVKGDNVLVCYQFELAATNKYTFGERNHFHYDTK